MPILVFLELVAVEFGPLYALVRYAQVQGHCAQFLLSVELALRVLENLVAEYLSSGDDDCVGSSSQTCTPIQGRSPGYRTGSHSIGTGCWSLRSVPMWMICDRNTVGPTLSLAVLETVV